MKTTPSFLTIYHQRLAALLVVVSMLVLDACSQQPVTETLEPLALSTSGLDYANDVAVVGPNLFVVGATTGSLDGNNAGATDIFVRRYATNGTLVWGRQFGTASYDYASYVATSGSGDVYVVGSATGPLRPFGTGAFIRKYDALGHQLWTQQFGSSQVSVVPIGLAVDNRFVYVVSRTYSNHFHFLKFRTDGSVVSSASMSMTDARPGAFTIDNAGDFYLLAEWGFSVKLFKYMLVPFRFGERPRFLWVKTVGGPWTPKLGDVVTDGSGNIYISYSFHSPDGNKATLFLTKFNTKGDVLFTRDLSPNNAAVQYTYADRLSVNADAIYVSGDTTVGYSGYANKGDKDVFVLKYNSSGTRLWTRQFGTNSHDGAYGLAVSGRVFVAGSTNGRPNLLGQGTPGIYNDDAFVRSLDVNTGSVIWTRQ